MNETRFNPARLRQARGDRNFESIAAAADCSANTVRNWEAGKSEPDASQLAAIAALTGRTLEFFFLPGKAA